MDLSLDRKTGGYLFSAFCLLVLASIGTGILFEENILFLAPAAFLFLYFTIFDFKKVFYLLIFIIPITKEYSLPGGLALDVPGEPILISLMFIFLFYLLLRQDYDLQFVKNPVVQLLFLHLVWIFITVFFSYQVLISAKFFLAKIWYIIAFVFLTGLFIKTVKDFKYLFWTVLIPTVFTIIVVILRHSGTGFSFEDINAACAIFYRNHVNYAAYVSLLMPFLWLAGTWYKKWTIPHYFILFCKVLFLVAIYFAFARGAWLALFASLVFYFVLKYRLIKWLIIPGLVGFILIGNHLTKENQYLNYAPEFGKAIYHGNIKDHLAATIKNQDVSTAERFFRWVGGVRMSTENPVTGFGPGNFYHYYRHYTVTAFTTYVSDNPEKSGVHNYFLMTLVEQGFVGLILFVLLTIGIFYYGVRTFHRSKVRTNKNFIAAILCSFVVIYVQLMLSDLVETIKIGGFFFMNLAFLVNQMSLQQKEDSEEPAAQEGDVV